MSLHDEFAAAVRIIRDAMSAADIGQFMVSISAEGRTCTDSDSVKIEYVVGNGRYGDGVKGDSVDACLREMLRRHGWSEEHAPLKLTHAGWSSVETA